MLSGAKCWEIRGSDTSRRGLIGLCKQGKCYGTVVLQSTHKVDDLTQHADKHQIHASDESLLHRYEAPWAWCVSDPREFSSPIPYKSRSRTWVYFNKDKSDDKAKAEGTSEVHGEQADEVADCASVQDVADLAKKSGIRLHEGHQAFKVASDEWPELGQRFKFGPFPTLKSRQRALQDAIDLKKKLSALWLRATSMKKSILLQDLQDAAPTKPKGTNHELRIKWVQRQLQAPAGPTTGAKPQESSGSNLSGGGIAEPTAGTSGPTAKTATSKNATKGQQGGAASEAGDSKLFSTEAALALVEPAPPALDKEKYILPLQLILKFVYAQQLERCQYPAYVPLLLCSRTKVTVKKQPRVWLKMCFWMRLEELQDIEKSRQALVTIQAECDMELCGFLCFQGDALRARLYELWLPIRDAFSGDVVLVEIDSKESSAEVLVAPVPEAHEQVLNFEASSCYVARAGRFSKTQLGCSDQLKKGDLVQAVSDALPDTKAFTPGATGRDAELSDMLTAQLKDTGKAVRSAALFQTCARSKVLVHFLRKHGYHMAEEFPPDFDHRPLLDDLSFVSHKTRNRMREACAQAVVLAQNPDWRNVFQEQCRGQNIPDLCMLLERQGYEINSPVDVAIAYGAVNKATEELCGRAEAAKSTKRGRPYPTTQETDQANVAHFLKKEVKRSGMSSTLVKEAVKNLRKRTADSLALVPTEADATTGSKQPKSKAKRKRALKRRYNRKAGDELSILKKREIAAWHHDGFALMSVEIW